MVKLFFFFNSLAARETGFTHVGMAEYRRLREKGKEHLFLGNYEKSIEYYNRALKEAKNLLDSPSCTFSANFAPQEVRVTCTNLPEHDAKTCEFCSKYLELAVCFSNRSLALCNMKSYENALKDAQEAINMAPGWAKVRAKLKLNYHGRLININFVSISNFHLKGYFRKAEALLGMEQYEMAKLFYEQVIYLVDSN